ncbi:MAG: hypothetical protein IT546_06690 [Caulobacteraceae bacterium]|nr:hypothetical protein [Caulobacteraceae bacterium]
MLGQLAAWLTRDLAPGVAAYQQSALGMSAGLIGMCIEEADRAVARRVEENAAIRGLLARGADLVEARLSARLQALAEGADASLLVSALEAVNAELRAALIDLHAAVEALDGEAARALEADIWAELRASTERRRLSAGTV